MAFIHCLKVLSLSISIFILVSKAYCYMPDAGGSDTIYDDHLVRAWEKGVIQYIQKAKEEERQALEIEAHYIANSQRHPSEKDLSLALPPEIQTRANRVKQQVRQRASCFGSEIENRLIRPFMEKCDGSAVRRSCGSVGAYISKVDRSLLDPKVDILKHRTKEGALEYAERKQKELKEALNGLQETNQSCFNQLNEGVFSQCTDLFSNLFRDERLFKHYAITCEPHQVSQNVIQFIEYMNQNESPAALFNQSSDFYNKGRDLQAQVARSYQELSLYLKELRKRFEGKEPTPLREPAADRDE